MGSVNIILLLCIIVFVAIFLLRVLVLLHRAGLKCGKGDGIIFGRWAGIPIYSPAKGEGHIAVFGGSGSGKTTALLIPALQSWPGSSFTIDISGDISSNVDCPNKLVYEPGAANSSPYDIFSRIDALDDEDEVDEALAQLAILVMPDQQGATSNSKYFQDGGRSILTAALIAFYHLGFDFCDICTQIIDSDYRSLFTRIDEANIVNASRYIAQFVGNSEQNISGCKQNCDDSIKLFVINKTIRNSIRRPKEGEVAFSPVAIEDHNVFVLIPDEKLELYAPLLHIITAQCLSYFSGRPAEAKKPILFALDEFASLGDLEIRGALRKLRKKHIRIMMLTQSLADIEDVYGAATYRSMLSNFTYKVVLNVGETDTQEYFAKLIGDTVREKTSTTFSSSGWLMGEKSKTVTPEKDYAIQPADLARLRKKLVLLHPDGMLLLKKNYYFKKHII